MHADERENGEKSNNHISLVSKEKRNECAFSIYYKWFQVDSYLIFVFQQIFADYMYMEYIIILYFN